MIRASNRYDALVLVIQMDLFLSDDYDEEEDLDEATRQFNFWTHQIHIFFGRKFLPAAQNMIKLKHAVERKLVDDSKMRCESSTALIEQVQVVIEEKTQA